MYLELGPRLLCAPRLEWTWRWRTLCPAHPACPPWGPCSPRRTRSLWRSPLCLSVHPQEYAWHGRQRTVCHQSPQHARKKRNSHSNSPSLSSFLPNDMPGVFMSTMKAEMPGQMMDGEVVTEGKELMCSERWVYPAMHHRSRPSRTSVLQAFVGGSEHHSVLRFP